MGGEDQLKGFIKQGVELQDSADKVELLTAGALALALYNIKRMIETMPQEGLLRNKSWQQLEPLVRIELEKYADELGVQMVRTVADAAPAMRDASVREFENAGASLPSEVSKKRQPVPDAVQMALAVVIGGVTLQKLFGLDSENPLTGPRRRESPIDRSLFKTMTRRCGLGFCAIRRRRRLRIRLPLMQWHAVPVVCACQPLLPVASKARRVRWLGLRIRIWLMQLRTR